MKIGDKVVTVDSLGTIVGVSTAGLPVVEWDEGSCVAYAPEELIVVSLPTPNEELDPTKEETTNE
jgi:hypothetical protein